MSTSAANPPVTETVHFIVNTVATEHEGGWKVFAMETGIVTYGATRDEAIKLNRKANVSLVKTWKDRGSKALFEFLSSHQIRHDFKSTVNNDDTTGDQLALAA